MSIALLYGQPGTGKSTAATGIALDYLRERRRVVANYPIDPSPACYRSSGVLANAVVEVIPSRPTYDQIDALGIGWVRESDYGREDRAGLLVVDEAGPWINSRRWAEKDREKLIDWLLQSRKRGWDLILVAQAPTLIDKQVREAVIEEYVRIRRTDRLRIPLLGIRLPRLHIAIARYGLDPNAPKLWARYYRGSLEQRCYQSYALFSSAHDSGWYSILPPRLTRFAPKLPPLRRSKIPLVRLINRLPSDQRLYHWRRFAALGAFD